MINNGNPNGKRDYISELVNAIVKEAGIDLEDRKHECDCGEGCRCGEKDNDKLSGKSTKDTVSAARENAEHQLKIAESIAAAPEIVVLGEHELDNSTNVGLVTIEYDRDDTDKVRVIYEGDHEPLFSAMAWVFEDNTTPDVMDIDPDRVGMVRDALYAFMMKVGIAKLKAVAGETEACRMLEENGLI